MSTKSESGRDVAGIATEVLGTVSIDKVTGTVTSGPDTVAADIFSQFLELLTQLRDEVRACRLALAELVNAGTTDQTDWLELAQSSSDDNSFRD